MHHLPTIPCPVPSLLEPLSKVLSLGVPHPTLPLPTPTNPALAY